MKLKVRIIFAAVIFFVFFILGIFMINYKTSYFGPVFIISSFIALLFILVSSEGFRKWDAERVQRNQRMGEIYREERARELGRIDANKLHQEQQEAFKNPFGRSVLADSGFGGKKRKR